jgi:DNA-binding response OmpR family regulator
MGSAADIRAAPWLVLEMTHIFVVEDDRDIAALIAHYFEKAGWEPHVFSSGTAALVAAKQSPPACIVLDLMLPGMDGLEVCRALRGEPSTALTPIVMVTARAEETDRIVGLEIGADDYIAKPFSPNELVARVRAMLRRAQRVAAATPLLQFGSVTMDLERHTVSDDGRAVNLTAKEFMLLQYFLQHRGRVLSRDVLLGDVWGYRYTGGTRTVDVHVRRLREKLPLLVGALVTVKQFGYKLMDE